MRNGLFIVCLSIFVLSCSKPSFRQPTADDAQWFIVQKNDLSEGAHHLKHVDKFGKNLSGYNLAVLRGIDIVQEKAMDGGGYFIGKDSIPTESPIGYELKLFGKSLINPPRTTSYCSGSSFAAFIEGLNLILREQSSKLSQDRLEAIRMQEPDGGRREDHIKFWGWWNADGYGNHFALVQYSGIGTQVTPVQARPGDFMNISWKGGLGHSVIFLGWYMDENREKHVVYWASQRGTNGLGDQVVALKYIREVMIVRLTNPEKLFEYNPGESVNKKISGTEIDW